MIDALVAVLCEVDLVVVVAAVFADVVLAVVVAVVVAIVVVHNLVVVVVAFFCFLSHLRASRQRRRRASWASS